MGARSPRGPPPTPTHAARSAASAAAHVSRRILTRTRRRPCPSSSCPSRPRRPPLSASFLFLGAVLALLAALDAIHQLEDDHRRVVARAAPRLDDARVTAVAIG